MVTISREWFRKFFRKFFLIEDTPHKIAGGAALGIFLGIFPGEGVISALIFSSLFRFNRLAATSGVLATNMWTTLVVAPVAALLGAYVFDKDYLLIYRGYKENQHLGFGYFFGKVVFFDLTVPFLVGFFISALLIALGAYVLIYLLLRRKRRGDEHLFEKELTKKT